MAKQPCVTDKLDWSKILKSGQRIFIGSHAAVPVALIDDMIAHSKGLHDIEVVQLSTLSNNYWAEEKYQHLFKVNTFFIGGGNIRTAVNAGRADYTPAFTSDIPNLFYNDVLPIDVALIMLAPADQYGYHSMGVAVDIVSAAAKAANLVVAQVNANMPVTYGQSFLHRNQLDYIWEHDSEIPTALTSEPESSKIIERIGQYIALLVDDGSTIQIGSGKISSATLRYLKNHKDLGVHSEMITDDIMNLMLAGVINNRRKTFHPNKIVTSFCVGSKALYDFVAHNPHIGFYPSEYVCTPANIARNDNMISINSAIEVDLTGQVVSDSIGPYFYSGVGGQVDFSRGASMSNGGKPIIAMPSTAKDGTISRIVAALKPGAGVVTTRAHVHYVVTEFGVASLRGKSVRERALELIRVAHPKFREGLLKEVRQHYWVPHYQQQTPVDVPELGDVGFKELTIHGQEYDLRPLYPSDERRLQEFFYSHTKETLQLRYNAVPTQMSREKSCTLVSVDQSKDLALCIVRQRGSAIQIQAVGRYYLIESHNSCEVAFVTREVVQGFGMASMLLAEMIRIAQLRGLATMQALVRADNRPMLNVFERAGFKRVAAEEPGEVSLVLTLQSNAEGDAESDAESEA